MQCKQTTKNKHQSYSVSFLCLCVAGNQTTNKEHPSYIVSFLCLRVAGSHTVSEYPPHVEQYASRREMNCEKQCQQKTKNEHHSYSVSFLYFVCDRKSNDKQRTSFLYCDLLIFVHGWKPTGERESFFF